MIKRIGSFFLVTAILSFHISRAQTFTTYNVTVCDTASAGYYFLGVFNTSGSNAQNNIILDAKGRLVYFGSAKPGNFQLHTNGLISVYLRNKCYLVDSTFTIVDSVVVQNGILPDSHDIQILPNGHFLLLGYENEQMDLSGYNMFSHNASPGDTNATVKCGVIQEQDENKNVVFEWHSKNYFAFDDVDSANLAGPANVDWTHFNAVELDDDGNLLVSSRHFNEITKINHSDNSIMWRLGGKRNQFTFINDPAQFVTQHDIRRIDNGNITLFDNGSAAPPFHPATAKEYQLNESTMTASLVWSYTESPSAYSESRGNVQRLTNGNTVVDYGALMNDTVTFNVVKPSGAKVFEVFFPSSPYSYRAYNYLTLPWQLSRPQISCYESGGQYYLDAGSGYTNYLWSTGATTQTIAVTAADSFYVFVPAGNTGFIASEYFIVTNPLSLCTLPNSLKADAEDRTDMLIFPNPASAQLIIRSAVIKEEQVIVEIFDFTGRSVNFFNATPYEHSVKIPVDDLAAGIYCLRIGEMNYKFVKE